MSFLDKENLSTIFEILIENNHSSLKTIISTNNIHESNEIVKKFNKIAIKLNELNKTNGLTLIEMNKQFIIFLINNKDIFMNNVEDKEENEITSQDIQKNRRQNFDLQLENKKQEFGSMLLKKPPVPNFSDNVKDEPIKNLDYMMEEVTAKRKYDTQQFYQSQPKPKNSTQPNIKYIKIEDEIIDDSVIQKSIIDITDIPIYDGPKKISWINETPQTENDIGASFLQKIRQIPKEVVEEKITISSFNLNKIMDKFNELGTKIDLLIAQIETKNETKI